LSSLHALPLAEDSEALWKRALEAVGDSVWDWHVQSGVEIYSPGFLALYGYAPGEIEETPEALDGLTHPDDREQMARDRDDHFAGRTPIYRNEHRVRCKDGSWKWILTRGLLIARDAQGRPLRMVGTHTDINARKTSEEQAWHQASHDALTGLPNRRLFGERLAHELRRARRDGQRLALLALDLDHFKSVNDRFGHDIGDLLLAEAAGRIAACVREIDMVARLGGDEFVVLLGDLDEDPGSVERIARELIARLARPYAQLPPGAPQPTASIGIALCPDDASEPDTLYRAADQALYAAKTAGRRTFRFHRARLQAAAHAHEQLGAELRLALQRGQLRLHYRRGLPAGRGAAALAAPAARPAAAAQLPGHRRGGRADGRDRRLAARRSQPGTGPLAAAGAAAAADAAPLAGSAASLEPLGARLGRPPARAGL
jgi:diguanylate cyclase (GGDEF)-like protein/PAS domain S-box-containing protein